MQGNDKTSQQLYATWYASLDPVDRELVDKVNVIDDDDYPFELVGRLSALAKERGGYYNSEAGWTVMWRPLPPNEYYEALKREHGTREAEDQRQFETRFTRQQAEQQRMEAWKKHHLRDHACITGYIETEAREGERQHFATGSFGTGVSFAPARYAGYALWEEHYGNAIRYWVPPDLAELRHRQRWAEGVLRDGEGKHALYALSRIIDGLNCAGDDLYAWAQKTFGSEHLVEVARSRAPIDIERRTDYALASKYYRIPVRMQLPYPSEAYAVGFGDTGCRRGPLQTQEQWEQDSRMHGWVPLGEEDDPRHRFPTEEDIVRHGKLLGDYAEFFGAFAGDEECS